MFSFLQWPIRQVHGRKNRTRAKNSCCEILAGKGRELHRSLNGAAAKTLPQRDPQKVKVLDPGKDRRLPATVTTRLLQQSRDRS